MKHLIQFIVLVMLTQNNPFSKVWAVSMFSDLSQQEMIIKNLHSEMNKKLKWIALSSSLTAEIYNHDISKILMSNKISSEEIETALENLRNEENWILMNQIALEHSLMEFSSAWRNIKQSKRDKYLNYRGLSKSQQEDLENYYELLCHKLAKEYSKVDDYVASLVFNAIKLAELKKQNKIKLKYSYYFLDMYEMRRGKFSFKKKYRLKKKIDSYTSHLTHGV